MLCELPIPPDIELALGELEELADEPDCLLVWLPDWLDGEPERVEPDCDEPVCPDFWLDDWPSDDWLEPVVDDCELDWDDPVWPTLLPLPSFGFCVSMIRFLF